MLVSFSAREVASSPDLPPRFSNTHGCKAAARPVEDGHVETNLKWFSAIRSEFDGIAESLKPNPCHLDVIPARQRRFDDKHTRGVGLHGVVRVTTGETHGRLADGLS